MVKNPPTMQETERDTGSIPELGRFPWRRKWQSAPVLVPGQRSMVGYSTWGRIESDTTEQLQFPFTFTFHFHALKKEMATHSIVLAWRTPGMREPGGLPSMGSHRVRHN